MTRFTAQFIAICILAAPVLPAKETKVAVIVLPGDDKPNEALVQQKMLDAAFQKSGDGLAWILVAFQRVTPELTQQDVTEQVKSLDEKGKKAYQYMKLKEAKKYFSKAAALMRARPLTRCNPEQPAKMYLYWARSVLDAGDDSTAQKLLGQIQRFDPDAEPDPAIMPPKLVATFDLATNERGSKPRGKLLLEIGPNPGTIVVNCRRMPPGVVEFSGVEGDELWIAAEISGGSFASSFTLPGGKRRQLTIFSGRHDDPLTISRRLLSLNRRMVSLRDLHDRPDSDLDRLAGDLGVDVLLLGQLKNDKGSGLLYTGLYVPSKGLNSDPILVPMSPSGNPVAGELLAAFDTMANQIRSPSVLAALAHTENKDVVEQAATSPIPKQVKHRTKGDKDGGPKWYHTWWFWTATGAVIAGAVTTGLVLGLSGNSTEPSGKVVLTISQP